MGLYKCLIGYSYFGQQMANILYYRDLPPELGLVLPVAQQELADKIRDDIVLASVGQTRLADLLPVEVLLDEVRVQAIDAITFLPTTSSPSVANIGLNALSGADAAGPMQCAIMQLVCPATTVAPTDYTPSGGYIAIGPIPSEWVDLGGVIKPAQLTSFNNFGAALVVDLDIGGGHAVRPIRIGRGKNSLGNLTNGFNDVQNASVRPQTSFRRSRNGA